MEKVKQESKLNQEALDRINSAIGKELNVVPLRMKEAHDPAQLTKELIKASKFQDANFGAESFEFAGVEAENLAQQFTCICCFELVDTVDRKRIKKCHGCDAALCLSCYKRHEKAVYDDYGDEDDEEATCPKCRSHGTMQSLGPLVFENFQLK